MQFKSGMLGACIVVVALLCSVIAGFTLGVEDRDKEVLRYDTITDVTGQFNANRSPYYADYTPSQNYTGYTPATVGFTETSVANPYRITIQPGVETVNTINLDTVTGVQTASNTYAEPYLINPEYLSVKAFLESQGVNVRSIDTARIDLVIPPNRIGTQPGETEYGVLNNWVQTNMNLPTTNTKWNTGGGAANQNYNFYTNMLDPGVVTPTTTSDFQFLLGRDIQYTMVDGFGFPAFNYEQTALPGGGSTYITTDMLQDYAMWLEIDSSGTVVCKETINGNTSVKYTKDYGSCYITWSDYITQRPTKATGNVGIFPVIYLRYLPQPITHTVKLSTVTNGVYAYMKIGDGVSLNDGINTTTWMNEHTNGVIDVLFRLNSMDGYNYNVTCAGADVNVSTNGSTVVVNGTDIGAWTEFLLRFDCISKTVSAIPVTSFGNFQEFTLSDTAIPITATVTDANTDRMVVSRANGSVSPTWSVASTTVWMDTYGTVMVNPTIDLRSYFPENLNPYLGLKFNNLSVIGQSVTINGTTYPVESGSYITVDDEQIPLKGLTVYYTPGGVSIASGNVSVDVGEVTDTSVSLGGSWYFLSDALNGSFKHVKEIDWDVGHWATTYPQTVIIFLGLLISCLLVAKHFNKVHTMDYIIVAFAGLIGLLVVA